MFDFNVSSAKTLKAIDLIFQITIYCGIIITHTFIINNIITLHCSVLSKREGSPCKRHVLNKLDIKVQSF